MLSKFSLIFNIILCYAVVILHQNEERLRDEIVHVHLMRYTDMEKLLERMDVIKAKVSSNSIAVDDINSAVKGIKETQQNSIQ